MPLETLRKIQPILYLPYTSRTFETVLNKVAFESHQMELVEFPGVEGQLFSFLEEDSGQVDSKQEIIQHEGGDDSGVSKSHESAFTEG